MAEIKSNLRIQRIKRDQELGSLIQISYDPDQPVVHLWTRDCDSIRDAYAEMVNAKGHGKVGTREYTHFLYLMKKAGFDEFTPNDEKTINGLVALAKDLRKEEND